MRECIRVDSVMGEKFIVFIVNLMMTSKLFYHETFKSDFGNKKT